MSNLTSTIAAIIQWLNIIVGLLIFVIGIAGNCLNVYVFTRPVYRQATAVRYLLSGSIASCIQLINTLFFRILSDGFHVIIGRGNTQYCQSRNSIAWIASLCAISYPCWASFDQFILTSRNPNIRLQWNSKRFVHRAIFATAIFWLIIYLPLCITTQAFDTNCISTNRIIGLVYAYGFIPFGFFALPISLMVYFNTGIVKNLRDVPVAIVSNVNKRMVKQVHQMLVPQLVILIISGLPFVSQNLYATVTAYTVKSQDRLAIENLIGHITRLLFYLNYISSFYIYMLTSSEFRRIVSRLFHRENIPSHHATVAVVPTV
jgi:hypothetical protein